MSAAASTFPTTFSICSTSCFGSHAEKSCLIFHALVPILHTDFMWYGARIFGSIIIQCENPSITFSGCAPAALPARTVVTIEGKQTHLTFKLLAPTDATAFADAP